MNDRSNPPFRCVTCEIEIAGPVTFHVGLPFCCGGCAANGPCTCSYDERPAEPAMDVTRVRHCLDIETAFASKDLVPRSEVLLTSRR
jgi:hypothetical protein